MRRTAYASDKTSSWNRLDVNLPALSGMGCPLTWFGIYLGFGSFAAVRFRLRRNSVKARKGFGIPLLPEFAPEYR